MNYLGIDPGMGAIKLWGAHGGTEMPAFIGKKPERTYASTIGTRKANATEIVVNGSAYYVGEDAHLFGSAVDNLSLGRFIDKNDSFNMMEVLLCGALNKHYDTYGELEGSTTVMVALPIEMTQDATAKATAAHIRKWIVGTHKWQSGGKDRSISIIQAKITTQPVGALLDYGMDISGATHKERRTAARGSVGVISVGFNTLEVMALSGMRVLSDLSSGKQIGARSMLKHLHSEGWTFGVLNDKLRHGTLRAKSGKRDVNTLLAEWANSVTGEIDATWRTVWETFDIIIIVGGGAILLKEELDKHFQGHAYFSDVPVMSIARGLYKQLIS